MSDTISLDWIAARLRAIQAEQRTLSTQYEFTRTMLSEVLRVLSERIGNFEALSEARLEQAEVRLTGRLDGLDRRVGTLETRLDRIETKVDGIGTHLDRIEVLLRPAP